MRTSLPSKRRALGRMKTGPSARKFACASHSSPSAREIIWGVLRRRLRERLRRFKKATRRKRDFTEAAGKRKELLKKKAF